jgi:hypothetical protein
MPDNWRGDRLMRRRILRYLRDGHRLRIWYVLVRVVLTLVLCTGVAAPAESQPSGARTGPRIEITLPTAESSVRVRLLQVADGDRFHTLLHNGFDVRVRTRAELWRAGRLINSVVASASWELILHHDLLDKSYTVVRVAENGTLTSLGTYRLLDDAKAALALPFFPPLQRPRGGAPHYFSVQVDVATLDVDELDELARWLRGDLRPAVQGRGNPGTAITRGVRTLVSRAMGGEVRRLEARSPRFVMAAER